MIQVNNRFQIGQRVWKIVMESRDIRFPFKPLPFEMPFAMFGEMKRGLIEGPYVVSFVRVMICPPGGHQKISYYITASASVSFTVETLNPEPELLLYGSREEAWKALTVLSQAYMESSDRKDEG